MPGPWVMPLPHFAQGLAHETLSIDNWIGNDETTLCAFSFFWCGAAGGGMAVCPENVLNHVIRGARLPVRNRSLK